MLRTMKTAAVLLLLAVILVVAGCSQTPSGGVPAPSSPVPGGPAPGFQLQSLDGQTISLSDLRGSPVLLNFWATWCGPCRLEMPFLQEVYEDQEWAARGLVMLAVNLQEPGETVRKFVEENGFTFTVLLDTGGEVGNLYNISGIPTTYFIDNDGIIKNVKMGAFIGKSDIDRILLDMSMKAES